ncbi:MAG TPA: M15 family metallopeptidase [Steroidobacteraceae bacterium]|nr:M15 family metallopeptidase [Steroidobacteraceae bacterium]HNS26756.1 M15 family metallopeptidase [Steroidobacteraceae bacterium]
MNALELTGRARTHVIEVPQLRCIVHHDVVAPLLALCAAARSEAGIELAPVSSFRDFERQREIWNAKYRGERPLLDRRGEPLDALALAPDARIDAILAWSALPGASRHHWGTDIDVIDRAALPAGYRTQLIPQEYAPGGVFARLDAWLAESMQRFGFFRPYTRAHDGVQPEPWHLSYAPVARPACAALTVEVLREAIEGAGVEGEEVLIGRLAQLRERYVEER